MNLKSFSNSWDQSYINFVILAFQFRFICGESNLYYNIVNSQNIMASINYSSFTGRKLSKYGVFTGPNTGNYGPEKTPHLDTFHSMLIWYLHRRIGWTFYISSYHGKKSSKFPDVAVGCQNRKLTYTFLVSKICENGLFLGWYLLDQSQQWKYQNNVWNLFTVFTANLRTHFTHCSGVYFVGLEQVNSG